MSPHRKTLAGMVNQYGWKRGAELGVDRGILMGVLLRDCPDLHLVGVDIFPDIERSWRAFEYGHEYAERSILLTMTTSAASRVAEDGSFDFVFIDADHNYESVVDDIACWRSKVRSGGWLGGHDYNKKFPGVVKAVDEVFGKSVKQWPGSIWGVWM